MARNDNRLHMGSARSTRNDGTITTVLWALRTKETDVTSSLQRYAALTRLELEEKAYAERSRGRSSCWTKILKSSPAVAEQSGFVFQRAKCRLRLSPGGHWLESH